MDFQQFKIDFIGIGAPRAGTTWLFSCLQEHPEICMSRVKETNFFNNFLRTLQRQRDVSEYKEFFKHCSGNKVVGEFSPMYFSEPEAPVLIKQFFPEAKLIACLRNPIEQLYSYYLFTKERGKHNFQTFEEFLEKETFGAKERVLYFKNLQNWLRHFAREKLLVLIYEDIEKDPQGFLKTVFRFLKVNGNFTPASANERINPSGKFRGWLLSRLAYRVVGVLQGKKWGERIINWLLKSKIKVWFDKAMQSSVRKEGVKGHAFEKEPIKKVTKESLLGFYRQDIEKLEQLLNRDLSFWK